MQEVHPSPLQSGQHVEVRGEPWLVVSRERFDRTSLLTMRGIGHDNRGDTCRVLTPFDTVRPLARRTGLVRSTRRHVLRTALTAVACSPRWSDCWTAGSARIDLRPWQLQPALAAVSGASRILLADEVGLGKTIQAALIISELLARGLAQNVLVLTPASLRAQWAAELDEKFGITATVFDHASLSAATAALPVGVNPWTTASVSIASIDLVKRPEIRAALDEVPLDVLVIDEAHHLTPASDRAAVVADLAARTPWVVMATATPHSGDDAAYEFLCGIGGSEPLAIYRRTSADVRETHARRVHLLPVNPTAAERMLLDATLAYGRTLWTRGDQRPGLRLVASIIARRAASSAAAVKQTLERRLALIRGDLSPVQQPFLPWDEGDSGDAGEADALLGIEAFERRADEVAWLERLLRLATDAATRSSKLDVIRRLLRRTSEHLIVFSEYRDVVQSIAPQISELASVAVIHGGVPAAVRRDVIDAFGTGRVRVLVTTDAAGEGLNLHAQCRLLVNLELPWNPLRLEQRIGRVDRLGQTRRVHAVHLFHRGSYEDHVTATLEKRRLHASIILAGIDARSRFEAIAAAVFGGHLPEDRADSLPSIRPAPLPGAAFAARERRMRALTNNGPPGYGRSRSVYARQPPSGRTGNRVVLLFAIAIGDGAARLVQRELVAIQVSVEPGGKQRRMLHAKRLGHLTKRPEVRAAIDRVLAARLVIVRADTEGTAAAIERRTAAIFASIDSHRPTLLQGSLFDRRAEQQRQSREATIRLWRHHLARRADGARALRQLRAAEPQLVAAWSV